MFIPLVVGEAAPAAGLEQTVTPHRLRAGVSTLLLDTGMPLEQRLETPQRQVQKFLRHNGSGRPDAKLIATTQIYAETSLRGMGENHIETLE